MVKRSRNQITQSKNEVKEECVVDLWEQRCKQHYAKKKRFTVLDDKLTNSNRFYIDYKTATCQFESVNGKEEARMEHSSHYAQLTDGNIIQLQRAKVISSPSLYGGNKLCFIGKIFVQASSVNLSNDSPQQFISSEILETDYYYFILENQ